MEGYLAVGIFCFFLGFYTGSRRFRRRISNIIGSLRREDEDDYDYDEDED